MKLIVGLGNPGEKYEKTRHNLGFMVVDHFFEDITPVKKTVWETSKKFKSLVAEHTFVPKLGEKEKIILVKPLTHMNASGIAVELLCSFYNIEPFDVWVVHDELDLPVGSMKIRKGGSSAGHRGIESIIEKLGTEKFWRFRMGIGLDHGMADHIAHNVDDFVLGGFTHGEKGKARELIKRGSHAISLAVKDSIETAMNRFNTK